MNFITTKLMRSGIPCRRPSDLAVFPVRGLGWTDLGEPMRVSFVLQLKPTPIRSGSPDQIAAGLK